MSVASELDALLVDERYVACLELLSDRAAEVEAVASLRLRRAKALARTSAIDRALLELDACLTVSESSDELEAWALIIELLGTKRCQRGAERQLARARSRFGAHDRLRLAEARMRRALDQRDESLACLQQQLEGPLAPALRITLAELSYVMGEFERAALLLAEPIADREQEAARLRLGATLLAARGDHGRAALAWESLAALLPESDQRPDVLLNGAFAHAADGQLTAAHAQLSALWRSYPDHPVSRYARRCATRIEQSDGSARRVQLRMPSTHQKRDFCGPAVLELCLRALGIELTQDEIAGHVKREHGTPMYEIVRFLEERQVEARRIVASDRSLRAAIDLGLPVILQEEYSTTSHVAVVSGYDDHLGVLLMHDPMNHCVSTRPFGWTEHAGALFGGGAVLVVGRRDAQLPEKLRAADEAGLVEAPHLRMMDDVSRMRASTLGDAQHEEATAEETLSVTSRVLSLAPNFRLAWLHQLRARAAISRLERDAETDAAFMLDLHQARTRFPNDEWPCQAHGRYLTSQGRFAEAVCAYRDAHLRDPEDGNNLAFIAECKRRLGELRESERLLFGALGHHAEPGFAEALLAAVYVRQLETSVGATAAGEIGPLLVSNPAELKDELEHGRAELVRRACHFADLACELDADNPFAFEQAGLARMHAGDWTLAEQSFERALELESARLYASLGLSRCVLRRGATTEAEAHLARSLEHHAELTIVHRELAALAESKGDVVGQIAACERALEACRERSEFVAPLLALLRRELSNEAACARLRELCEAQGDDSKLLWTAARALDTAGQRGHAIALLRKAVAAAPDADEPLTYLGKMLSEDYLTRDEGRDLLERVIERAPGWAYPRRCLALTLLDEPERGLACIEPVLQLEDPYLYEVEAILHGARADAAAERRATRRALAAFGDEEFRARTWLCDWHTAELRYESALRHARALMTLVPPAGEALEVAATIVSVFRLSGRMSEIMDWVRQRCVDERPPVELAFDVYYGCDGADRAMAAEAARVVAERMEQAEEPRDRERALPWRVREATMRAHLGDRSPLDGLRERMGTSVSGWAELAWAYADLHDYGAADACAARAYELAPEDADALTVMLERHERHGAYDLSLACAQRIFELHPYEHRGPERLAELHAKRLEVAPALAHSAHAADAAPFCHIALESRALALFVAGELEQAERYARRSLALSRLAEPDAPSSALWVVRAIICDREGLERSLQLALERVGRLPPAPFVALLRQVAARAV